MKTELGSYLVFDIEYSGDKLGFYMLCNHSTVSLILELHGYITHEQ